MERIQITAVSNSFNGKILPEWVKDAFLGLEFPVAEVPEDQKPLYRIHSQEGTITVPPESSDFHVELAVVTQALREKNPEAVRWLEKNTLVGLSHGPYCWFSFTPEECSLVA